MASEESQQDDDLAIVNLERVKRISDTFKQTKGKKKGSIPRNVVEEVWKGRLSPRFFLRLMNVMFPEDSKEVSFLSFYTIYKNLAEPETEIMFRALTIYHIATIHEPPFNYEQANEYPNASYKSIKDYVCDVITSYLHAAIHIHMKEALAWLDLKATNTLIDGNLVATYMLKDLETHRNEVSIGSLEVWLEKNEMYYSISEQLYLFLFGVNKSIDVKPLLPFPDIHSGKGSKTLLAMPDVLLLNSKLPKRAQRWSLAYIMDSRSDNWETFKQAIYGKRQTIIVIQDANGDIFGMYGSQQWIPSEGFYGNDESFLFTLKPDVNIYDSSGRDNHYQIFTDSGIGMGGAEDQMGLRINSSVRDGSTSLACSTFRQYWPLAKDLHFTIHALEIWIVTEWEDEVAEECEMAALPVLKDVYLISEKEEAEFRVAESCAQQQEQESIKTKPPQGKICCCKPPITACRARTKLSCSAWNGQCAQSCCAKRCPERNVNRCPVASCSESQRGGEGDRNHVKISETLELEQEPLPTASQNEGPKHHPRCPIHHRCRIRSEDAKFAKEEMKKQKSGAWVHPSLTSDENEKRKAGAFNHTPLRRKPSSPSIQPSYPSTSTCGGSNQDANKSLAQVCSMNSTNISQQSDNQFLGESEKNRTVHEQVQVSESKLLPPSGICTCVDPRGVSPCNCTPSSPGAYVAGPISSIQCISEHTVGTSYKSSQVCSVPVTKQGEKPPMTTKTDEVRHQMPRVCSVRPLLPNTTQKAGCKRAIAPPAGHNVIVGRQEILVTGSKIKNQIDTVKNIPKSEPSVPSLPIECKLAAHETGGNYRRDHVPESSGSHTTQSSGSAWTTNSKGLLEEMGSENESSAPSSFLECHCSSSTVTCSDLEVEPDTYDYLKLKSKCSCRIGLTDWDKTRSPGSSMCSCFLKSSRDQARKSVVSIQSKEEAPSKAQLSKIPGKETSNLLKSLRNSVSTQSANLLHLKVPPTCLNCKCVVGSNGCECASGLEKSKQKAVPLEQSPGLLQSNPPEFVKRMSILKSPSAGASHKPNTDRKSSVVINLELEKLSYVSAGSFTPISGTATEMNDSVNSIPRRASRTESTPSDQPRASCHCSLNRTYFPQFPEDEMPDDKCAECDCTSNVQLKFPTFVETPPQTTPDRDPEEEEEGDAPQEIPKAEVVDEQKEDETCPCSSDEGTIVIFTVPKCNKKETMDKIMRELDQTDPNVKSLVVKVPGSRGKCSKDLSKILYPKACYARPSTGRKLSLARCLLENADKNWGQANEERNLDSSGGDTENEEPIAK